MQQSAAFKILRTRLKTLPSYSFKEESFRRISSGIPYPQFNYGGGSQICEEGDLNENSHSLDMHNGINFASKLQQFQQIQKQHHLNSKLQTQSRFVSTSSAKVSLCLLNLLIIFDFICEGRLYNILHQLLLFIL